MKKANKNPRKEKARNCHINHEFDLLGFQHKTRANGVPKTTGWFG